jgi:ABC-type Fe3+-hydroxamate transport system substrate-binding protein
VASGMARPCVVVPTDVHSGFFLSGKEPVFVSEPVRRFSLTSRRRLAFSALAALIACGPGRDALRGDALVDDFGDTLRLQAPATRIVSLNPVTTELLFALDAGERLVGRTSWDLFPDAARAVPDMGAGMGPNIELVIGQRPDLVILYASESNRRAAQQFRAAGIPTLTYRTDRVEDLHRVIPVIARAIGADTIGRIVSDSVRASVASVRALPRPDRAPRAFWHIWETPLMTIGGGSYLSELLEVAGATNVFADLELPSPQVSLEEVARRDPDVVLAGPNSAARIRTSPAWQSVRAVREGRVVVIDTLIVGRPGVRVGETARFLRRVLVDSLPR